jgi:hypothetical protein
MTQSTFAEVADEMLEQIEPFLGAIEEGGGDADLHRLRLQLVALTSQIERDPGIETAMTDLYSAAAALVEDRGIGSQPMARKLRLLRDARRRFRDRLTVARRCEEGRRSIWQYRDLPFAA